VPEYVGFDVDALAGAGIEVDEVDAPGAQGREQLPFRPGLLLLAKGSGAAPDVEQRRQFLGRVFGEQPAKPSGLGSEHVVSSGRLDSRFKGVGSRE
jgi:hypothetical protein